MDNKTEKMMYAEKEVPNIFLYSKDGNYYIDTITDYKINKSGRKTTIEVNFVLISEEFHDFVMNNNKPKVKLEVSHLKRDSNTEEDFEFNYDLGNFKLTEYKRILSTKNMYSYKIILSSRFTKLNKIEKLGGSK